MGGLVAAATIAAFLGVHISRGLLKKMTIQTVRRIVGVMLLALGMGLCAGIV